MNGYNQFIPLPYDLDIDEKSKTITVTSKKGRWVFREGRVITFNGLENDPHSCYLIYKTHPNGLTLINSSNSIPIFRTFTKWFQPGSIFHDVFMCTGWMTIK